MATVCYDRDLTAPSAGLDPAQVVAALRRHGCFLVRGLLPDRTVAPIRSAVDAIYESDDALYRAGRMAGDAYRRSYSYGLLRPFENDYRLADGTPLAAALLSAVLDTGLAEVVRGFLAAAAAVMLEASHIRRQAPVQRGRPVPYHQDASVLRMPEGTLLNFWFPLCEAGADAPGLELIPQAMDTLLPCARRPGADERSRMYSNFEIEAAEVARALGDVPAWRPTLAAGDVLCLHGHTVHRTNMQPHMTGTRVDFEVRFCRKNDIRAGMPGEFACLDNGWSAAAVMRGLERATEGHTSASS